ncbi:hypothetical protein C2E23DRAFT_549243 [Lenzites betulinus]|nr:hypothetical protein C2E23DRAFT_549243 [Lenzites betulinus]
MQQESPKMAHVYMRRYIVPALGALDMDKRDLEGISQVVAEISSCNVPPPSSYDNKSESHISIMTPRPFRCDACHDQKSASDLVRCHGCKKT